MSTAPTPIPDFTGDLPNPADPVTFTERGLAWWNHERYVAFPGMNDLAENAYDNALAAEMSADTAAALAGATMWSAATNYATGTAAISPINGQTYRRKSPGGVEATDPSASANWWLLGGTAIQKAGDTGVGSLSFDFAATIGKDSFMDGTPSHDGSITSWSPTFSNPLTNTSAHVGVVPNGSGSGSGYYAKAGAGSALWGGLLVNPSGIDIHSSRSSASGDEGPINFKFRNVTKISFAKDGTISSCGLKMREGYLGATLGAITNFYWTGSAMQCWINATNVGTVTITSDYRIKRDIRTMEKPAIERIAALRPVLYKYADNAELHTVGDAREREGFIAHELAEVVPSAVEGEKDAPNQVQSLRIDALVAVLVKAVQEQQAQINELRARVGS